MPPPLPPSSLMPRPLPSLSASSPPPPSVPSSPRPSMPLRPLLLSRLSLPPPPPPSPLASLPPPPPPLPRSRPTPPPSASTVDPAAGVGRNLAPPAGVPNAAGVPTLPPLSRSCAPPPTSPPPLAPAPRLPVAKPAACPARAVLDGQRDASSQAPPAISGDEASPRVSAGATTGVGLPAVETSVFSLEWKEARRAIKTLSSPSGVDGPSLPTSHKTKPSTDATPATRPGVYDNGSLTIIRVMYLAAKQRLSWVSAVPKWMGV
eukprot:TRINITY_DN6738_c0_g1_i1.p1 TRINITY_DN6738_c0_g1~~TRINITY_DN6738_c0_g1_i1.p1  ORF type:complete len:262 (-),score=33.09 TRINITY_DN6738_c0_g1_i1:662-1447(-)